MKSLEQRQFEYDMAVHDLKIALKKAFTPLLTYINSILLKWTKNDNKSKLSKTTPKRRISKAKKNKSRA